MRASQQCNVDAWDAVLKRVDPDSVCNSRDDAKPCPYPAMIGTLAIILSIITETSFMRLSVLPISVSVDEFIWLLLDSSCRDRALGFRRNLLWLRQSTLSWLCFWQTNKTIPSSLMRCPFAAQPWHLAWNVCKSARGPFAEHVSGNSGPVWRKRCLGWLALVRGDAQIERPLCPHLWGWCHESTGRLRQAFRRGQGVWALVGEQDRSDCTQHLFGASTLFSVGPADWERGLHGFSSELRTPRGRWPNPPPLL